MKDNFIQKTVLDILLKDRVSGVTTEYENGDIDFDSAVAELDALSEMKFDGAKDKRTEIMASYTDKIVLQYENGEITYDNAVETLQKIKEDGYTKADSLIDKITASNNAVNALEKADEYYESGDYEKAISEYSKIPESSKNYEEAQNKLNQVYSDYISSTVKTAKKHNSYKNYKQAVQVINTAYGILPDSVDTTDLDTIKEESLASYKTEIANKVVELSEAAQWSEAFSVIDEAIAFDDNEYFRNLKTITESRYVTSISATVRKHLDSEDYISAKRVVANALTVLPNNVELKELKNDVEDSTPTYLLDVCNPYESSWFSKFVNGETFAMGGKTYTNGFTLAGKDGSAIFNIDNQYTAFNFLLGHIDGTEMYGVTVKIYCDGILKKELDVKSDALPQKIAVDITGVSQIKIVCSVDRWATPGCGFANVTVK